MNLTTIIMIGTTLAFFIGLYLIDKLIEDLNKKTEEKHD